MKTRKSILKLLEKHKIPFHTWGTGESQSLDKFVEEVLSGEVTITTKGGKVFRHNTGSTLHVFYKDGEKTYYLREEKQIFRDGREVMRNLAMSIGEKLKVGETIEEAAYRALREELNIHHALALHPRPTKVCDPRPSVAFPGIFSVYTDHLFEVYLSPDLYKPEGYTEVQKDKTSIFKWQVMF